MQTLAKVKAYTGSNKMVRLPPWAIEQDSNALPAVSEFSSSRSCGQAQSNKKTDQECLIHLDSTKKEQH